MLHIYRFNAIQGWKIFMCPIFAHSKMLYQWFHRGDKGQNAFFPPSLYLSPALPNSSLIQVATLFSSQGSYTPFKMFLEE